jgi:hypothetical protein
MALTEQQRYELIERAAIKEYCGNMPRPEAERQAKEELKQAKS